MHPAVLVDGVRGLTRHIPVALHHQESADQDLALLATLNRLAGLRVDDLHLDVWVRAADGAHSLLDRIVHQGLVVHRRGLRHAVGNGDLVDVHNVHHLPHRAGGAGSAGHNASAQAGQVIGLTLGLGMLDLIQFRHEHRRHTEQAGGLAVLHRFQHGLRVEHGGRDDGRCAVGDGAQIAHHHAEAVEEGNGDHDLVLVGVLQGLPHQVAVVQDVAVGQRRALRHARGTGGVLDVDGIVRVQLLAHRIQVEDGMVG